MNYLAHLYFAKPTADSHFGNLLGDFGGRRHLNGLSQPVKMALDNHYLVDKFTDNHPLVKEAKQYFSDQRKRFASIALDVVFDHFLIHHWSLFCSVPLSEFKTNSYQLLNERLDIMPSRMQRVVSSLTTNDWFKEYETLQGTGLALDNIAKRVRFANQFTGAIEDVELHYQTLEKMFLAFMPELIEHVNHHNLEGACNKKLSS